MNTMPLSEQQLRDDLVNYGRSLFQRGLSSGGSGNISAKLPDGGFLVTPTNSCLGELDSQTLSKLDAEGTISAVINRPKRCQCTWRCINRGHNVAR